MTATGTISAGPASTAAGTMAAASALAGHGHRLGRSGIAADQAIVKPGARPCDRALELFTGNLTEGFPRECRRPTSPLPGSTTAYGPIPRDRTGVPPSQVVGQVGNLFTRPCACGR